ncbi:MAG: hypothetical protein IIA67_10805, partial [Planctomycetes bacterium]|nr:hypothetical protein [Planctomycetota bacterium]
MLRIISPEAPLLEMASAKQRSSLVIATGLALGLLIAGVARGGDWPQILGPRRDGVAH